jgi:hypothetical protein
MAKDKGKKQENTCGVSEVGGKYVCAACHTEIPQDEDCPTCKRHVDWDRARIELNRFIQ